MQLCPVRTPNVERTHGLRRQRGLSTVLYFVQRCLLMLLVAFASGQRLAPALSIVCAPHAENAHAACINELDTHAPNELHRAFAPVETGVASVEQGHYEPEPSELQGAEDDQSCLWCAVGVASLRAWPAAHVVQGTVETLPPQAFVASARQRGPPRA